MKQCYTFGSSFFISLRNCDKLRTPCRINITWWSFTFLIWKPDLTCMLLFRAPPLINHVWRKRCAVITRERCAVITLRANFTLMKPHHTCQQQVFALQNLWKQRGTTCSFENLTISPCCLIFLHCLDWCFIILLSANYYEALPNTCKLAFLNYLSEVCIKLTPLFFEILPSSSLKIDLLLYMGWGGEGGGGGGHKKHQAANYLGQHFYFSIPFCPTSCQMAKM